LLTLAVVESVNSAAEALPNLYKQKKNNKIKVKLILVTKIKKNVLLFFEIVSLEII